MALRSVVTAILLLALTQTVFANRHPTLGVPPELIGNDESLALQNKVADKYGFKRIKNLAELQLLMCAGVLEKVVVARDNIAYYLTAEKRFRYARPEAVQFLNDFSKKFFERFGKPLKITELIRTGEYQRLLVRRGKTQADGSVLWRRSAHLTGSAFDISKKPLTSEEAGWLRDELVYWEAEERIEATEEIYYNTFHVMVFPSYSASDAIVASDEELIKESGCKTQKPAGKKSLRKNKRTGRR